jgi:hypothetical protein
MNETYWWRNRKPNRCLLKLERLEDRLAPTVSATFSGGVLSIKLDQTNDVATISNTGTTITVVDQHHTNVISQTAGAVTVLNVDANGAPHTTVNLNGTPYHLTSLGVTNAAAINVNTAIVTSGELTLDATTNGGDSSISVAAGANLTASANVLLTTVAAASPDTERISLAGVAVISNGGLVSFRTGVSGALALTGTVQVGGATTTTVDFDTTVNGPGSLKTSATGTTRLGQVGTATALASLTTNSAGTTQLRNVTTTGD